MRKVTNPTLSHKLGMIAEIGLSTVGAVDSRGHAIKAQLGKFPLIQEQMLRAAAPSCAECVVHGAGAWYGKSSHYYWPDIVVIYGEVGPGWVITPDPSDWKKASIRATTPREFFYPTEFFGAAEEAASNG